MTEDKKIDYCYHCYHWNLFIFLHNLLGLIHLSCNKTVFDNLKWQILAIANKTKYFLKYISTHLVNLFYLKTRIGTFNSSWLMTPAREECRNWRPVISHGKKGTLLINYQRKYVVSFVKLAIVTPSIFVGGTPICSSSFRASTLY